MLSPPPQLGTAFAVIAHLRSDHLPPWELYWRRRIKVAATHTSEGRRLQQYVTSDHTTADQTVTPGRRTHTHTN